MAMFLLTDGITLNFFAMGGNGRFHIVAAFSVLGVT
jgi:hypothetical protein